jgi:hypothetical protein
MLCTARRWSWYVPKKGEQELMEREPSKGSEWRGEGMGFELLTPYFVPLAELVNSLGSRDQRSRDGSLVD